MSRRWPQLLAIGLALLVIGLATLVPLPHAPLQPLRGLEPADLLVNLCLFAPLGWFLARAGTPWPVIALCALAISTTVELLQSSLIPGRRGTAIDVLANGAGALLGALLCRSWARLVRPPVRPSTRRLLVAAAFLPLLAWIASGPLLRARPPATPAWWGQWAHHFAWTEPFRGTIQAVTFQGVAVPDGRIAETAALRAAAGQNGLDLRIALAAGGPTEGLTHLASVASGSGGFVIGMEQLGRDLLVSWQSAGAALGFRAPRFSFPAALAAPAGAPVELQATLHGVRLTVVVRGPGGVLTRRVLLTPLSGWRNLIPTRGLSPAAQRGFDLVWALGCLGYLLMALRGLGRLRVER